MGYFLKLSPEIITTKSGYEIQKLIEAEGKRRGYSEEKLNEFYDGAWGECLKSIHMIKMNKPVQQEQEEKEDCYIT